MALVVFSAVVDAVVEMDQRYWGWLAAFVVVDSDDRADLRALLSGTVALHDTGDLITSVGGSDAW